MEDFEKKVSINFLPPISPTEHAPTIKDVQILDDGTQKGHMSMFSGMCMVIGMMIGSGIFSIPGHILKDVQSPGVAIILWVLGGVVTLAGTFCYIELGCMLPKSGGEQAYLDAAFKKPRALVAFLFCWSLILCVRPGSAAADSVIFAKYTMHGFLPPEESTWKDWLEKGVGILCITSITAMNAFSTRLAVKIHDALTVIKVLTLMLITIMGLSVALGAYKIDMKPDNWSKPFENPSTNGGSYAAALFGVFWAFDGWNNLNYAVGELKDPVKNLPKAAGLGVSIVIVLYLMANVAYMSVLPADRMMESGEALAAVFFEAVFGPIGGQKVMPMFIGLAAYGAVCAMVFSSSRVIQAAAEMNLLPCSKMLRQKNKRFGTPVNALLVNYVISLVLIVGPPSGAAFSFLVEMVGYPTWVFYGLSVVGLVMMRKSDADLKRPVKVWMPVAIFFIIVSIFLSIFPFFPKEDKDGIPFYLPPTVGTIFILSGVPVWWKFVKGKDVSMDFDGGH